MAFIGHFASRRGLSRAQVEAEIGEESRLTLAGLAPPNPATALLLPGTAAMADPPDVTLSAVDATSAITGAVDLAATALVGATWAPINTDRFRHLCGEPIARGQTNPDRLAVSSATVGGTPATSWLSVDFMFDGAQIEIRFHDKSTSGFRRYRVDGEYVSATPSASPGATNHAYRELLDFTDHGGARSRHISIDFGPGAPFRGVTVGPTDTVWYPTVPAGPRVIILGDSYVAGGGSADGNFRGWCGEIRDLLGWRDVWASGVTGTGYVADGGASAPYPSRVAADVVARSPDIVIVWGSQNDANTAVATVTPAVRETLAAIRAGVPDAALIVIGPQAVNGLPAAVHVQNRDAIRAEALAVGALHIDTLGGVIPYSGTVTDYNNVGWITGNGKVSTPAGTGNADRYIGGAAGTDANHPTNAGHTYYAQRIAAAISAAMPL